MLNEMSLEKLNEQDINNSLNQYLKHYTDCFSEPSQTKYFQAYQQGILSGLDRKSIEPIALHFLDQKQVRGMQQFFKRSKNWETNLTQTYRAQLANQIADPEGFASADESCFVKKTLTPQESPDNTADVYAKEKTANQAYLSATPQKRLRTSRC
jgi:SRSO17 transposase